MGSNYAGHGPWQLVESVAGESWTLARNPNYYDTPKPYVDAINRAVIVDSAQEQAQFQAGKLDTADIPPVGEILAEPTKLAQRHGRLGIAESQGVVRRLEST